MNGITEFRSSSRDQWLDQADNLALVVAMLVGYGAIWGLPDTAADWTMVAICTALWIGVSIFFSYLLAFWRLGAFVRLEGDRLFVQHPREKAPLPLEEFLEVRVDRSRTGERSQFYFLHKRGRSFTVYSPPGGQQLEDYLVGACKEYGIPVRVRLHCVTMSAWWPLVTFGCALAAALGVGWYLSA